jgi:CRISPR/Cas system-associated exonuclease Cas4 (RecB family)
MSRASALMDLAAAVALACVFLLGLLWATRRQRSRIFPDLTDVRIIASDTGVVPPRTVRDRALGLYGKPDYVLAEGTGAERRLIPVEVKPRRRSKRLYDSDEIQLGVYLLGMRATYGREAAGFGFVRYAEATFRVELTATLEHRVMVVADAIRAGRAASVIHRSHDIPARCAGCAMRQNCSESLV